jgi:hypothetical protein
MSSKRPIGLTIISILMIVNGSFLLFSGIVVFFLASNFATTLNTLDIFYSNNTVINHTNFNNDMNSNIISNFNYFLYFIAVTITIFAFIHFLISYGLLKGKSWARNITLIISFISILGNIFMIIIVLSLLTLSESIMNNLSIVGGNILTIIINIIIIWYLLKKEVRGYFDYRSHQKSSFSSSFDDLR